MTWRGWEIVRGPLALAAVLWLIQPGAAQVTQADSAPEDVGSVRDDTIADHVAEASARFAVPSRWIRAVIRVESGGGPSVVSRAGAMGLMQIMPATWRELSSRHGLGDAPFAPRANILAGTAYLRELYDRFGAPGVLAAYNAGPERYAAWLRGERPLPLETRAYVARLAPMLGMASPSGSSSPTNPQPAPSVPWTMAPLFAGCAGGRSGEPGDADAAGNPVERAPSSNAVPNDHQARRHSQPRSTSGLFVELATHPAR